MFSRNAIKQTAWAALIAVLFAVLLPTALNASGKSSSPTMLSGICTVDGAKAANGALPDVPDQNPAIAVHKPCMFCTSSVPVFADANAPHVVAVVDDIAVYVVPDRAETLPPDDAATKPLSPRAPPRLS